MVLKKCSSAWNNEAMAWSIESLIDSRLDELSKTFKPWNVNEVLKDKTALSDLRALQEKYVIVPVDKATGNRASICNWHYASVLVKELGHSDK